MMDYERIGLAVAEMLDVGYTPEWIGYLMDIFGVPKTYPRPVKGRSKYLFCKDLFAELQRDPVQREVIAEIASYIVKSERFDNKLKAEGMKHLPVFKDIISKAGFKLPADLSMRVTPVFRQRDFIPNSKSCFVLMPFMAEWSDRLWNKVLKPILVDCGLDPRRADDFFGHDVMEDVWLGLNTAYIIVADVTTRNANVFYELGVAHTLGKNVIVISQSESDIPFDIRRFRHIRYSDNLDGYEKLRSTLPRHVEAFYSPARREAQNPAPPADV